MQKVIGDFIHALRHHGLPVSPAETLDALQATELVGLDNPLRLKTTLSLTLAKNLQHRAQLEVLFDQFFQLSEEETEASTTDAENSEKGDNEPATETSASNQTEDSGANEQQAQQNNPDSSGPQVSSPLAQQLLSNDQSSLQVTIASAGKSEGATEMQLFTQKSQVSYRIMQQLGDRELNQELAELSEQPENLALVERLQQARQQLREQVSDYVEQQYLLFTQKSGEQLRENNLKKIKLTNVDHSHYHQMSRLVQKSAKRLASMHSRRKRVTKHGQLDTRKTIAANAAYDGFLFHTKWKSTKVDRPKVMVLCDVSGSVSRVARFLLLFLYSLQDVLPRVRSFVFASDLGEVTDSFDKDTIDVAITKIMDEWANRPTDYGIALQDFRSLALKDIDKKTTVIMLGDARNNNADPKSEIWEEVYKRSQRVLWLNPEGRYSWNTGDSVMREYAPHCSLVEPCNSLRDITRILGTLLQRS
ncbi:MAG: VWA containing CoxE family protein [Cellvibrionaceae bacterium]|nr:VWA containing CoxE family protein [Cellvibrionaceae bacterium]|tara:strand:+ start:11161 stop:12585 length:1425 start_codon:yes stop_codon:yes gene_type:complete